MSIRRFARVEAKGRLASYVHGGAKIGVLVDVVGGDEALAKDLAMHIAASKPVALSASRVPAELVQKERDIAAAKAAESGKPANIVEKMVEGTVQKFLKEVTLLGQPFVKRRQAERRAAAQVDGRAVAGFALYVVGEGIEKKQGRFRRRSDGASRSSDGQCNRPARIGIGPGTQSRAFAARDEHGTHTRLQAHPAQALAARR